MLIHISKAVKHLMPRIYQHQFNVGLYTGKLPKETFYLFLQQDKIYLYEFSRVLKKIAHKIEDPKHQQIFFKLSNNAYRTQYHLHNKYLDHNDLKFFAKNSAENKHILPKLSHYISFLHNTVDSQHISAGVASCVACFFIYSNLGFNMQQAGICPNNPYTLWINSYSSKEFLLSNKLIIEVLGQLTYEHPTRHENAISIIQKGFICEMNFWTNVLQETQINVKDNNIEPLSLKF